MSERRSGRPLKLKRYDKTRRKKALESKIRLENEFVLNGMQDYFPSSSNANSFFERLPKSSDDVVDNDTLVSLESSSRDNSCFEPDLENDILQIVERNPSLTRTCLSSWLVLINKHKIGPKIPSDYRSLLHTPRNIKIKSFQNGGEYYHFGLKFAILGVIESFFFKK